MNNKICSIHQPNFIPWLGYFNKIKKSDIFVFLDNVQNQKTGGSWTNRTYLDCYGKKKFFTCPLVKVSGTILVKEMEVSDQNISQRFLEILYNYYRTHLKFEAILKYVESILKSNNIIYLSDFNIAVIKDICARFNIKTKMLKQSELNLDDSLKSNELLISICKAVDCNIYLAGDGASGYQENSLFYDNGLEVTYNKFECKPYYKENFIPGLSILDYLMHHGFEANIENWL